MKNVNPLTPFLLLTPNTWRYHSLASKASARVRLSSRRSLGPADWFNFCLGQGGEGLDLGFF